MNGIWRSFHAAALAAITGLGCASSPRPPAAPAATGGPAFPFGSRPLRYPAGSIRPSGTQQALDALVRARYDRWKAASLTSGCGGRYVKDSGEPGQVTSSPANAAGMMVLAFMAGHDPEAQSLYDGILTVARKFPSYLPHREGNLAYAIVTDASGACAHPRDKKGDNTGDSTVEGDLDFAFALLLGARQWGHGTFVYADEAKRSIATIRQYDFNPESRVPLIGDWASLPDEPVEWKTSTKTSLFMLGHFRAFAALDDAAFWTETVEKLQALTAATAEKYAPATGLVPLYLRFGTTPPEKKMLGAQNAGHFVGDAGSLPFRLAADYLASGDARSRAALGKMLAFVQAKTGGDPAKIVDGYKLDGAELGTKRTPAYLAPFGAAAIFEAAQQTWLDATWALLAADEGPVSAETLLNLILISGNWWQP